MGAQGSVLAIMPRTTAMVPHEQKGVATAAVVATTTPARRWRPKKAEIRSVSMNSFNAVAITTLNARNGQLCCKDSQTCSIDLTTKFRTGSMGCLHKQLDFTHIDANPAKRTQDSGGQQRESQARGSLTGAQPQQCS